ncbi:integrase, catalytic region, zinc finger, CCHC-type containing protein [Tanacetum coccineum]|uniref:Integrase, catalytic region, zinc finger, CCHC-type containing protein n=1 Tax=Tanacetum coccineum TaxID=301880 RepID=A0ABQ5DM86_9ASTR
MLTQTLLVEIILFIVDSGCSKHMTGNLKLLTNFVEKFLGTVKFGNDQIAPILGYGDLVQGTITIKRVYYVEGLNHNLFSVGQFCDADLEVAFQKSTCYIRDLKGNDLLTGSRGTYLYSISLQDSTTPNPICLMAKATSSQAWLWHRRLSYLNFDTINLLSKNNIVNDLPKLKFVKDHLGLHAQVTTVQTDKGTEFLNKTLHAYFAKEGIRHETSTARTPEQNGVVERRNRTLVEAARTMLSAAKVPLFFWAEAIATACFTQNRSLVIPRHEKTPYHIINARKPSVKFFHIFGSLCYIVRDGENLDKMKEKGDACIFVGYSTQSKAYRVFNKRTRMIVETIHVNFDELPQMASDHVSSDPGPQCSTTVLEQDSLSPGPQSQENVPQVAETVTTSNELELLYSPMFSELLNGTSHVVSKSSAVHAADNPDKRQQHNTTHTSTTTDVADPPPLNIHSTHQTPTQVPTVTAPENIIQAETNTENAQFDDDEFINIFSTPVQESRGDIVSVSRSRVCVFICRVPQVLWLRTQLTDYGFHFDKIPMYCDSKAAIAISAIQSNIPVPSTSNVRYQLLKEQQLKKGISSMIQPELEGSTQGQFIVRNKSPYVRLEKNEYKGIMPTKIELTLKQSQQGVSNDVLAKTGSIHNLSVFTKMNSNIEERRHGPSDAMHNPSQPFNLIPAESNSLLHAHTQAIKTYYNHQDSRIKKAQELNTKTSINSDIQDLPKSYQDYQDNDCQGRLLASFQDDA